MVLVRLLWNPSPNRIHSSRPKLGGRPPLDLQLWSRLLWNPSAYQDSQLSAQGRKTTSFGSTTLVSARLLWNPSAYEDSQLAAQGRRTTSFGARTLDSARLLWNPSAHEDSQLWAQGRRTTSFGSIYNFGLGCFGILWYIRIPSSGLKVGGRPPLDLQLWSRLGCFGILRQTGFTALGPS